jgi:hypothetical protein
MSAGIGSVSAEQTYTDISAGARETPPSDAVPGLLSMTLAAGGAHNGTVRTVRIPLAGLEGLVGELRHGDLVIAFAAPPPPKDRVLPIGIAGRGFDGNLTSDSTRTDGYVLATDIAPTILRRLGIPIPDEMNGEPIRSEGSIDLDAVEDRTARMTEIPERRWPVVAGSLAVWIAIAGAVALVASALRRRAIAWAALAVAYMPLLLLAGAALEPSALAEGLLVAVGAAALAALTLALAPGWRALAIACAATTLAYAIDVAAGSELTTLSLLGPNPVYGARFYGIGNELEALIAVMVPVGVGAGLTAAGELERVRRSAAVAAFLVAGFATAFVFAAGRLGADVGAAIVLPVGAAVAAATLSSFGRTATTNGQGRTLAALGAVIAAPFIALLLLALIDLVSGANAHLTRSVLDAGGAGDLADTVERRLRLSADDFGDAAGEPLFWLVVAALGAAIARWRWIDASLRAVPLMRAAFLGACAAVAVGTVVNDSGATFLVLGGLALLACLAYSWSQMSRA